MLRVAVIVAGALLLSSCTTNVYQTEAGDIGTAAATLAKALPSSADVEDAAAGTTAPLATGWILNNGPLNFSQGCLSAAHAFRVAVISRASDPDEQQDTAYSANLKSVTPCALEKSVFAEPPVAAAPIPLNSEDCSTLRAGQASTQSVTTWTTTNLASRCGEVNGAKNAATVTAQAISQAANNPPGKGDIDAYIKAISDYANSLKAITASTSLDDVNKSLGDTSTALDSLVKAADPKADASPITKLLGGIAKMAIEQAQFEALRRSANAFNAAWDQVAPSLKLAVRLRYAEIIEDRATANFGEANVAQIFLNQGRSYSTPAQRLELYNTITASLSDSTTKLQAACVDPGPAINGFTKANAALTTALNDPKRQVAALVSEVQSLKTLVAGLSPSAKGAEAKAA
jgi:hypothetical protein